MPGPQQATIFSGVTTEQRTVRIDDVKPPDPAGARGNMGTALGTLGNISTPLLREIPAHVDAPVGSAFLYRVVDGSRRVREYLDAELESFGALVVPASEDVTDAQLAAMRVSRNVLRSPNPMQEAQAFQDMIDAGATEDTITNRLGVNRSTVRKRLRLFTIPTALQEAVRAGEVAVTTAERVANLSPEMQKRVVDHYHEETDDKPARTLRGKDVKAVRQRKKERELDALPDDMFGGRPDDAPEAPETEAAPKAPERRRPRADGDDTADVSFGDEPSGDENAVHGTINPDAGDTPGDTSNGTDADRGPGHVENLSSSGRGDHPLSAPGRTTVNRVLEDGDADELLMIAARHLIESEGRTIRELRDLLKRAYNDVQS